MLVITDAVDNAEVMLSCISLAYKESASEDPPPKPQSCARMLVARASRSVVLRVVSRFACLSCPDCRLEAQYGHQQDVDMIPLVRGY